MGDIAEYMIEQIFDSYDRFSRSAYTEPRDPPTCKRCGKERLHWEEVHTSTDKKWALFEGESKHVCKMADDEFEDLTGA